MEWKPAERLSNLTSAIFSEMNRRKREVEQAGVKVIDLGIGSPDQPPRPHIIQALKTAVGDPNLFGYPTSEGSLTFRQAAADWYQFRFGVALDPEKEVVSLMGSQDGLAHFAQAWINPGDVVLVPDPGYPIYAAGVSLAGGVIHPMPLTAENEFLPDFSAISPEVAQKAKFMILNYPNNPLAATAEPDFFRAAVRFATQYKIMIVHDLAYSEMAFDGYRPSSFLEVEGAMEVGVEFNSLSKSFNMAGCRIGYAVGNAEILRPLATVKSHIDYGVFLAVQQAAIAALKGDMSGQFPNTNHLIYQERRDLLVDGLQSLGWLVRKPKATMFLWARVPEGWSSEAFAFTLLEKAGVVVIPGNAFGSQGEGYVRIALVQNSLVLQEVIERISVSRILSGTIPNIGKDPRQ